MCVGACGVIVIDNTRIGSTIILSLWQVRITNKIRGCRVNTYDKRTVRILSLESN